MRGVMVAAALLISGTAQAGERTGFQAIAAGDLATAERQLEAERRIFPDRPELMLNLAAVYAKTNRADLARSMYVSVLDRPAVNMDMPNGTIRSSHAVARAGLMRVASVETAAR